MTEPVGLAIEDGVATLTLNLRVSADEAAEIGLVTRVVNDDALSEEGKAAAAQLAAAPIAAFSAARSLLADGYGVSLEAHLERELRSMVVAAQAEGREGLAAFAAKRKPAFGRAEAVPSSH